MRAKKLKERRDSNLNLIPEDVDEKAFMDKRLETCIMEGDVECTFFLGQRYDLSVV